MLCWFQNSFCLVFTFKNDLGQNLYSSYLSKCLYLCRPGPETAVIECGEMLNIFEGPILPPASLCQLYHQQTKGRGWRGDTRDEEIT